MWVSTEKTFNNAPMLFQFYRKNGFCIFSFTNMKQLYSKEIHESLFASVYSPTNKIEVDIQNVIEFLENIKEMTNVRCNFYPDKLNIKADLIISLSEGFPPFKLEFEVELKDENNFYNKLTCPLLKTIKLLKQNQEDLFEVIKNKDLEISEYKLQGANITHEHFKTETFERNNFILKTQEEHKDLYDESLNLCEIYSSPLTEQFIDRQPDEYEESIGTPIKEKSHKIQTVMKKSTVECKSLKSSTTVEISHASINVKKRKQSSLLKNL